MVEGRLDSGWRGRIDAGRQQAKLLRKRLQRGMRNSILGTALGNRARRAGIRAAASELTCLKEPTERRSDGGVTVVACMRDEAQRLPDFLHHYRLLGASGFILIDNQSRDATREVAMAAPDFELLSVDGSYAERLFGMDWVMAAIGRSGLGQWYLAVDIDELFVYDACEHHDLGELVVMLEANGQAAMPVMMVDMYGPLPIARTFLVPGASMIDACPFFDVDYKADAEAPLRWDARRRCIRYLGGPRARMFSTPDRPFQGVLAKTPLMYWDERSLYIEPHAVYPFERNLADLRGGLLHFKFFSDFHDRAVAAIEHGQHWNASSEYRHYLRVIEQDPTMSLFEARSWHYRGSYSLAEAGLMTPLPWRHEATGGGSDMADFNVARGVNRNGGAA